MKEILIYNQIASNPPTSVLMTYDVIGIVVRALKYLNLPADEPGSCERGTSSFHADTLLNYLRSVRHLPTGVIARRQDQGGT